MIRAALSESTRESSGSAGWCHAGSYARTLEGRAKFAGELLGCQQRGSHRLPADLGKSGCFGVLWPGF